MRESSPTASRPPVRADAESLATPLAVPGGLVAPARPPADDDLLRRTIPDEPAAIPGAGALTPRRLPAPLRTLLRRLHGLERDVNLFIAGHVLPRVPGLRALYARQLRTGLTVSDADVRVPDLPVPFEGTRVLFVTDVHAGPFLTPRALEQTFARLAPIHPDLILVGGDVATSRLREFLGCMRAFSSLSAPLGVYGVLGNHDHYTEDTGLLSEMIEKCGIRLLTNRAVAIERGGARLVLAGVDDLHAGRSDLDAALASACDCGAGNGRPLLLLSHNPDLVFEAAARQVPVILSGHTHGGQIRIPGLPLRLKVSRYGIDQGRYRTGPTELIVSRGLGVVGLPLRVGCTPEVMLLTLRRG